MATRTPKAAAARRLALLRALLAGPFDNNKAELGRRLGFKDGSLIGQYVREERALSEATEAALLALPEARGLDLEALPNPLEAHPVSQYVSNLTTPKHWSEFMTREMVHEWPAEVTVIVPDGSLEPHVTRGDHLTFSACNSAEPTSVVVIEQPDGTRWIRRLVLRADGSLWGVSTKPDAFPDMPATTILARAIRRTSDFNGF